MSCPKCNKTKCPEARFCWHCGFKFSIKTEIASVPTSPMDAEFDEFCFVANTEVRKIIYVFLKLEKIFSKDTEKDGVETVKFRIRTKDNHKEYFQSLRLRAQLHSTGGAHCQANEKGESELKRMTKEGIIWLTIQNRFNYACQISSEVNDFVKELNDSDRESFSAWAGKDVVSPFVLATRPGSHRGVGYLELTINDGKPKVSKKELLIFANTKVRNAGTSSTGPYGSQKRKLDSMEPPMAKKNKNSSKLTEWKPIIITL